ncbi:hypothetical protein HYV22_03885 [Candidatus Gottesmanbacteria bacterium]|nr:hypothetical protein [Candidatus Gottesmanbacteria bacterium]
MKEQEYEQCAEGLNNGDTRDRTFVEGTSGVLYETIKIKDPNLGETDHLVVPLDEFTVTFSHGE